VTVRVNGEKAALGMFTLQDAIGRLQYLQILRCHENMMFKSEEAQSGEMGARKALRRKYQGVRAR